MTTITKDITAKFAVAAVAVAMIFSAYAPAAQAQTTEDTNALIATMLQQIADLQAQLSGTTTGATSASAVCPHTWTRDLTMGSEGADVMKLQQFLNETPDLRVAATGAGSPGMETMYYGPATAAAVSKMQVMFRAEILAPNLVNPTGYFGPSSRAKANSLCVAAALVEDMDEGEEGTEEEEEETGSVSLQGEGTLTGFEIDDEEDEVAEGEEDVVVAIYTLESENGDVELARLGMSLVADNTVQNEEEEPWDAFEEISLWIDGDKVASFDASDEDEYLNEDLGTFRFSNLGLFLEEDEEVEVYVAVSVQNSVDGADVANAAKWAIQATSVRYFDADGVAVSEDVIDEMILGNTDAIIFDIVEEGTDDDASIESNSNNPDESTLLVDDSRDSDEYTVQIFDIEVDRDSSDLVLEDAFVWVTVSNPAGGVTTTVDKVISEVLLEIDGESVEGEAINSGTADTQLRHLIAAGESNRVGFRFEFDGMDLDSDTDYEAEVSIVFESTDDGADYENTGVTVQTEVIGSEWEVEGSADDNVLRKTDDSELHTLATVVPVISGENFDVDRNEAGDAGNIAYTFSLEASGENDYSFDFGDVADIQPTGDAVVYNVSGGTAVYTASITKLSGDATQNTTTGWTVEDGDEATFVVDFVFSSTSSNGAFRVNIETIGGVDVDMTSSALNLN